MKLYATIESERATKAQGGQKYINIIVTSDKIQIARVLVKFDNLAMFDKNDKIVYNELLKGEKQKGERCPANEKYSHDRIDTICRGCGKVL